MTPQSLLVLFIRCSLLVGVVLASFVALIIVGSHGVQIDFLTQQDWSKLPSTVPVLYIAMVFHNVIPVVTTQLEGKEQIKHKKYAWVPLSHLTRLVFGAAILSLTLKVFCRFPYQREIRYRDEFAYTCSQ